MTESETWVRRRLQQLGDTDLPVGGSATADRVVATYRRRRRARAAWLGTAAAVVLAVSVPVALAATQVPSHRGAIAATGSPSVTASLPTTSAPPRVSPDPGPPAHWAGPASAEVGVAYPFDLDTHCGIRWARFAGREWAALHPAADPLRLPNAAGITTYTGYVAGTMRLVGPDLLRFTFTDPYVAGRGQSFDFVPARGRLPLCA